MWTDTVRRRWRIQRRRTRTPRIGSTWPTPSGGVHRLAPHDHLIFPLAGSGKRSVDTPLNNLPPPARPPLDVRRLLRDAGLRPRKSLGQNFLIDESALEQVAAAAAIRPQDTVLEIGAGVGSLTRHLAAAARQVAAVEIDPALIRILRFRARAFPECDRHRGGYPGPAGGTAGRAGSNRSGSRWRRTSRITSPRRSSAI